MSALDPSAMFHSFYDGILGIINKHIPGKQIAWSEHKLSSKLMDYTNTKKVNTSKKQMA